MNKKLNRISSRISKRIRKNTLKSNKTKYNKLNKIAGKTIQLYNFDELSEEAKKKALETFNDYYQKYCCSSDLEMDFDKGTYVEEDLKEIGIPVEDIEDYHWDWNNAWIVGTTSIYNFIKSANININLNEDEEELFDYVAEYCDFDFLTADEYPYIEDLKETCEEYYLYELDEDDIKPYENIINKIVNIIEDIYKQFDDKVEKANEYLTEIMDGYQFPTDEDLEDLIKSTEAYFYEDGTYYMG